MTDSKPVTVLCIYRVKKQKQDAFHELLKTHWPTLKRMGLVTARPAELFRGQDRQERQAFIEIFQWKDEQAPDVAHQTPEVMKIWEPMGALAEDMEFIHMEPLEA